MTATYRELRKLGANNMTNRTFLIVSVILAIVAAISLSSYLPARTDAALKVKVANFPKAIGQWQGTDMPVTEQDYAILETRNLFVRDYKNKAGESVYLYLIYSEDNRKVSHPPEVCFLGSGMTITDKSPIQISNRIKAIKLMVEKKDLREMVVYWYKAGNLYTDNYLRQQLKVVLDRTLRKRTSGALIRLSTIMRDDDQEAALKLIRSFAGQIEPELSRYIP
jgi:EpsI family protein